MLVLISYDVNTIDSGGRRRLRRVAKACLDWGQRVQFSVFECEVDPAQWTALRARLIREVKLEKDSLRFSIPDEGGLLWTLSFDPRRHRAVLLYLGGAITCFGLILTAVDWVAGRLATLNGQEAPPAGQPFGQEMLRQVRQFQRANGLLADGVVGAVTAMQLNRAAGVEEPRLLAHLQGATSVTE